MINQLPFPSFFITVALLVVGFVFFMAYILVYHAKKTQQHKVLTKQLMHEHEMGIVEERVKAQEDTLNKVGSALHDTLGQQLHILKLQVEHLSNSKYVADHAMALQLHGQLLDDIIEQVRRLSHLILHKELQAIGFEKVLEQEVIRINLSTHLNCSLQVQGQYEQQELEVESLLNKVLKESIQNAIKHANATHLYCALEINATCLRLEVRDNGKGMTMEHALVPLEGRGINSMREEAERLGARVAIKSSPGEGMEVVLTIGLPF